MPLQFQLRPRPQSPLRVSCHSQWTQWIAGTGNTVEWTQMGLTPPTPASDDIDLALAALMKGLPEIAADELETLLNDLPMPEPGAKNGISVKEALEVSTHAIKHVI